MYPTGIKALGKVDPRRRLLLALSGAFLAAHFYTWNFAIHNTTVANAVLFFAFNPVFAAVLEWLVLKEKITQRLLVAIVLGATGAIVTGISDINLDSNHIVGDLAGLASGGFFALYFLAGRYLTRDIPIITYSISVYGVSGLLCFILVGLSGQEILVAGTNNWIAFALLGLFSTGVGHSAYSYGLKHMKATVLSLFTLLEPILVGIGAYFFWGESITPPTLVGFCFIGAAALILTSRKPLRIFPRKSTDPETEASLR